MIKKLTPETDAFFLKRGVWSDEILAFCRKIERERDEARELAAMWKANHDNQVSLKAMLMDRPDLGDRSSRIAELIRERDEVREKCSKLEKAMSYSSGATTLLSRFLKVLNERNGLIQKLDAWEEIAEHLHHLVQHPAYGVDQAIRRMDVLEAYKHLKHGH